MTEEQKELLRKLAERKRAIILGFLPIHPLFWYGVYHVIPNADVGAGIVTFVGCVTSMWLAVFVGIMYDRYRY